MHADRKCDTYYFLSQLLGAVALTSGLFPGVLVHILTNVQCDGSETSLLNCPVTISDQCLLQQDAAVVCQGIICAIYAAYPPNHTPN